MHTETPIHGSGGPAKRQRTALKLNIVGTERAALAPTLAEEADAVTTHLIKLVESFCGKHKYLLPEGIVLLPPFLM